MTVWQAIVRLSRASYRVLRLHPRLAALPVLSLVTTAAVLLALSPLLGSGDGPSWQALLVLGLAAHLAHVFFATALTSEALRALRGDTPSLGKGLAYALRRSGAVVTYTAATGAVGILNALLGRSSRAGIGVARALVGTTWSLATYLALPVMVQEGRGGISSLRRSAELFRRTWGETTLSEVGVRVLTAHLSLVLLLLVIALLVAFGDSALAIVVVVLVVTASVALVGALEAIYRSALYVFASEGVVPEPFDGPELDDIWRVK